MDENDTGLLDRNADDLRRRVLYDVLFSGGNIEWYFGFARDGGDISVEDFRSRQAMWTFSRHAPGKIRILAELRYLRYRAKFTPYICPMHRQMQVCKQLAQTKAGKSDGLTL